MAHKIKLMVVFSTVTYIEGTPSTASGRVFFEVYRLPRNRKEVEVLESLVAAEIKVPEDHVIITNWIVLSEEDEAPG